MKVRRKRAVHRYPARQCWYGMDQFSDVQQEINDDLGIFNAQDGSPPIGVQHLDAVKERPTHDGVEFVFCCPQCGRERRLSVDWFDLISIAADVPPQLVARVLERLRVISSDSEWDWDEDTERWYPHGFPCSCGIGCGNHPWRNTDGSVYRDEDGNQRHDFTQTLPGVTPAEARKRVFMGVLGGELPRSFLKTIPVALAVGAGLTAWAKASCRWEDVKASADRVVSWLQADCDVEVTPPDGWWVCADEPPEPRLVILHSQEVPEAVSAPPKTK